MTAEPIAAERIDESLVALGAARSSSRHGRELPLRRVERRAGTTIASSDSESDRSVRLPSAPGYVPQVRKEQVWLPRLRPATCRCRYLKFWSPAGPPRLLPRPLVD